MIDSHCHLFLSPLHQDLTGVLQRAQENGVSTCIVVGVDLETSQTAISLAQTYTNVYACIGIHPDVVASNTSIDIEKLKVELSLLAHNKKVLGIGECGLDYTQIQESQPDETQTIITTQKRLFGMQIQLAKQLNLPLSLHVRSAKTPQENETYKAHTDALDTLAHFCSDDGKIPPFVLHCASGSVSYLEQALSMGAYVSFAGNATYKSTHQLLTLLHQTPLNRLLIETDSPFLSPSAFRGKPCEPAFVRETLRFIAKEIGKSEDELDSLTENNTRRFFSIS